MKRHKNMDESKLKDNPAEGGDESTLTEEQKAERLRRRRAGMSINETVAADANLSVGSRGTNVSGVEAGAGAGAGSATTTAGKPGESPAPKITSRPRGAGTTPLADTGVDSGTKEKE